MTVIKNHAQLKADYIRFCDYSDDIVGRFKLFRRVKRVCTHARLNVSYVGLLWLSASRLTHRRLHFTHNWKHVPFSVEDEFATSLDRRGGGFLLR